MYYNLKFLVSLIIIKLTDFVKEIQPFLNYLQGRLEEKGLFKALKDKQLR